MAYNKFNLRYRFLYQYDKNDKNKFIEIQYPITIDFVIQRGVGQNTATFTLYNLKQDNTNIMRQDLSEFSAWRQIIIELGYDNERYIRFIGNVMEAYTLKSGADIKTVITANTDSFNLRNGDVNEVFKEGTDFGTIFKKLSGFTDLSINTIDEDFLKQNRLKKTTTFFGRPLKVVKDLLGEDNISTDLKQITIAPNIASPKTSVNLKKSKANIFKINEASGLLNTPRKVGAFLDVEMILEPRINLYDVVLVESRFANYFDGYYKVLQIVEDGTITKTGETTGCITKLKLTKFDGIFV